MEDKDILRSQWGLLIGLVGVMGLMSFMFVILLLLSSPSVQPVAVPPRGSLIGYALHAAVGAVVVMAIASPRFMRELCVIGNSWAHGMEEFRAARRSGRGLTAAVAGEADVRRREVIQVG